MIQFALVAVDSLTNERRDSRLDLESTTQLEVPVDLTAVTDLDHEYHEILINDRIDDSPCTLSNSKAVVLA